MSLPHVSQQQIDAMMRAAEKKFGKSEEIEQILQPVAAEIQEPINEELEQVEIENSQDIHKDLLEDTQDIEVEEPKETKAQSNWRMLREKAERAERLEKERDELLKHVLSSQQKSEQPKVKEVEPVEEDYLSTLGLDDDSLVEGKHFKAYLKKQKELERELAQYKQKSTMDSVEIKLKSQYKDFDNVVSADNLARLRQANPDLADVIMATPDIYKQASIAYQMIKQYGIYKDNSYNPEKEIIAKNAAKPRSASAAAPQVGSTPMSQANMFANGMTEEVKKALYKEMIESARRR